MTVGWWPTVQPPPNQTLNWLRTEWAVVESGFRLDLDAKGRILSRPE